MTRDVCGNPLTPGHNVDHVDVDAGMRQAQTFGYDNTEHIMEIQYNLQRWARGEEEQADHSMARSLSGVSYTDWRAILAMAIATAEPAGSAMPIWERPI